MIARFADGRVVVQDFRETAPSAATRDLFGNAAGLDPKGPPPSEVGHLAVGVPGLVAGRCQALARFGTVSLARALQPALRLAVSGFPVDAHYLENAGEALEIYEAYPSLAAKLPYVYRVHLRNGKLPDPGTVLYQPELAHLLERLAEYGRDFFYGGAVAEAIVAAMQEHGGILTLSDLADYEPVEREPLRSTYRGYDLILMPSPSSGGVALAEALNVLETLPLASLARSDLGLAVHYQIEALKHAMADRARHLGDTPSAADVAALLTSKAYAKDLAQRLMPDKVARPDTYGSVRLPDHGGTSHFCVVDREGNVVVSTETINTSFGSLAAIDEWGLILNNQMDDFAVKPGEPNAYGLVQSEANAVQPGRRPLSSMAPTIVLKDGKPFLLLGASGGPRIISSVLNVLLSITDFGLSLEAAITRLRPHHQWRPDTVCFDEEPAEELRDALLQRQHQLSGKRKSGVVQAILRDGEEWIGASDPRKGGRPAGD
jgi:gamma-glutamyltranspeptidase/glutathione hydrolase